MSQAQWWRGSRAANLAELLAAHHQVAAVGATGRYATRQLNYALILRLAGEFQGFARDLHDEVALLIGQWSQPTSSRPAQMLATGLVAGRQLDNHANASPEALAGDFGRFGIQLFGLSTVDLAKSFHV